MHNVFTALVTPLSRIGGWALALSAAPAVSLAQGAVYAEAGVGELAITELGTGDVKITSPLVRVGYQSASVWFVEGEGLFASATGSRTYVEVTDARLLGLFAGARVEFSPRLAGLARIGAQQLHFEAANTAALSPLQPRIDYDATVAVVGLGAAWTLDENNGLRLDATVSNEADGAPRFFSSESGARTLTLSYRRTF
jgi:Outer membrane protein beta-barrel domain